MDIAPKITAACLPISIGLPNCFGATAFLAAFSFLLSWIIWPNATTQEPGSIIMEIVSIILEITVGFSNGVAEFAPKNPPPFVPRCLIASSAATGQVPDPASFLRLSVSFHLPVMSAALLTYQKKTDYKRKRNQDSGRYADHIFIKVSHLSWKLRGKMPYMLHNRWQLR